MTGESVPVDKIEDPVDQKAQIGDRKSMAYSGTLVVSGRAKGIVVATGGNTELGHINQMLSGVQVMETPLLRQIEKFGKVLTIIILIVCAITFAYGRLFLDIGFVDMFKAAVGVAVSAIPEGLPAIVTITLAIGVQRMATRHAIIRRLPAVETLGSVSRICSDKTGTLTRNEMVISAVAIADSSYEVTGEGYAPRGEILKDGKPVAKNPVLETMARASVLCNESSIHEDGGTWKLTGDPTEGALLPFAAKVGLSAEDGANRLSADEHDPIRVGAQVHGHSPRLAPLRQRRSRCRDQLLQPSGTLRWNPGSSRSKILEKKNEEIASKGQRVLALACLKNGQIDETNLTPEGLTRELVLLGLVGIIDPPRDEAIAAVKECHQGGIRVTMITGDHAVTEPVSRRCSASAMANRMSPAPDRRDR